MATSSAEQGLTTMMAGCAESRHCSCNGKGRRPVKASESRPQHGSHGLSLLCSSGIVAVIALTLWGCASLHPGGRSTLGVTSTDRLLAVRVAQARQDELRRAAVDSLDQAA